MSRMWNYVQNGQSLGPVPEEQLKAMLASGAIRWEDLVWREGLAGWIAARSVPELLQPAAPAPAPIPMASPIPMAAPAPRMAPVDPNPYAAPQSAFQQQTYSATGGAPEGAIEALRGTKPWVRFLAILGFVYFGLVTIFLLIGLAAAGSRMGAVIVPQLIVWLIFMAIFIPMLVLLNSYATKIGALVQSHSVEDLVTALRAQKSYWVYVGILTLVMVILGILGIIIAIASVGSAFGRF